MRKKLLNLCGRMTITQLANLGNGHEIKIVCAEWESQMASLARSYFILLSCEFFPDAKLVAKRLKTGLILIKIRPKTLHIK